MSVLKSDNAFSKSPIIPNIKNPEIIKEFLYQSLSDKNRDWLDNFFSSKPNNFSSLSTESRSFDIIWAETKITGIVETLPNYLSELKNQDKCFLLYSGDPLYPIMKIDY